MTHRPRGRRARRAARPVMAAVLALAAGAVMLATAARAQPPDSTLREGRIIRPARGTMRLPMSPFAQPLIIDYTVEPTLSQRPFKPLTPEQAARLREARAARESGLLDRSRSTLIKLADEVPHHPLVLTDLARVDLARDDYAAVERLASTERLQQRDSLLMASELIVALERLARAREAAEVALEAWAVGPAEAWAGDSLMRLGLADPKGVREAVRSAARRLPDRSDIVLAAVRLEWLTGDDKEALRSLAAADGPNRRPPLRSQFAEELLASATSRDSSAAAEALLELAADTRILQVFRMPAARRAWDLSVALGSEREAAPRLTRALADFPPEQWDGEFLMDVARALRRAGLTAEARALLATGERNVSKRELELEQALADLRDGPPQRALPRLLLSAPSSGEAAFRYAEALFFAGQADSALNWYQRVAKETAGDYAGLALERIYLIEDADPRSALPAFGRIAYEEWRGEPKHAAALTDSLYHALDRGPLWAQVALRLAAQREASGEARAALEPLLAVADSLPGDRLAPLARERAGDICLGRLKDAPRALAQYEECLARYPRAWNAAAVRRKLEQLRRDRRL